MPAKKPSSPPRRRILVIEDDPLTLALLQNVLDGLGFDVAAANNTADGKKKLREHDPDLAVIDIDLGFGPTGIDFAQMLARTNPHVAAVFLSHLPEKTSGVLDARNLPENVAYLNKLELHDASTVHAVIEKCLRPSGQPAAIDGKRHKALGLSQSQYDVVALIASGMTIADVAHERSTSVRAVQAMLRRIQAAHPDLLLDSKSLRRASALNFLAQL